MLPLNSTSKCKKIKR